MKLHSQKCLDYYKFTPKPNSNHTTILIHYRVTPGQPPFIPDNHLRHCSLLDTLTLAGNLILPILHSPMVTNCPQDLLSGKQPKCPSPARLLPISHHINFSNMHKPVWQPQYKGQYKIQQFPNRFSNSTLFYCKGYKKGSPSPSTISSDYLHSASTPRYQYFTIHHLFRFTINTWLTQLPVNGSCRILPTSPP